MAFHSDALTGNGGKIEQTRFVAAFKSAAAVGATIGFLVVVQPDPTVLLGAAAITSLSLTFVSLLQSEDNWVSSTPKLDAIYAVLVGMMAMLSFQFAAGSLIGTASLMGAMILGDLAICASIAAGVSSLTGMYQAPVGIALTLHSRLFGLLGRAV